MKKLVKAAASRKVKRTYKVEDLIKWYIEELEENYPETTAKMKSYRAEVAKHGNEASAKLNMRILSHCAYKTENENGELLEFHERIDIEKLINKIPDTTESMYSNNRYKKFTKKELEDLCK